MPETIWVVIGLGMGLESSTITKKVLRNPAAYGVDLDRLIVISAQTGMESEETKDKMEQLIYPDLAAAHIRTVQVARAGSSEADGIVVLSDTRSPTRCYIEGGPYTLADEMEQNGTLPQLAHRRRTCSTKHKGFCLDTWLARELAGQPFRHLIGFNCEELDRVAKDHSYATKNPLRRAEHPLVAEGWGCLAACTDYCPMLYSLSYITQDETGLNNVAITHELKHPDGTVL